MKTTSLAEIRSGVLNKASLFKNYVIIITILSSLLLSILNLYSFFHHPKILSLNVLIIIDAIVFLLILVIYNWNLKNGNLSASITSTFMAIIFIFFCVYAFQLGLWIISTDDSMIIQQFETSGLSKNISGESIASLLNHELQSISEASIRINNTDFNRSISGIIEVPRIRSDSIKYSIINVGSVGISSSSFSLGQLISSTKQLLNTQPTLLKGSISRYGSTLELVAIMEKPNSSELITWEVNRSLKNKSDSLDEYIPSMVKDLAYKISLYDAEKTNKINSSTPRTWKTFKCLIEGQKSYVDYKDTGNEDFLDNAYTNYFCALKQEPNYEQTEDMLYIVGMEYLAKYRENKGNPQKSEKYFNNTEDIFGDLKDKGSFKGATALGLLYMENGSYEKSNDAFNDSIALEPDNKIGWYNKGALYQEWGNSLHDKGDPKYLTLYNMANRYYNLSLELDNGYSRALYYKGTILLALGDSEGANNIFNFVNETEVPSALALKAKFLYKQGIDAKDSNMTSKSLLMYQKYINSNTSDLKFLNDLGNAYYANEDYINATKAYANFTRLNFRDPIGWCNKGRALYSQTEYGKSLDAFDEAIDCNKNYSLARIYKSMALFELGKINQAKQAYNESIRLDKNILNNSKVSFFNFTPMNGKNCNLSSI
jgi:Tfp pilus assembly protein PilF